MEEKLLTELETVVMEYSGPMGKFVVRKQLKDIPRPYDNLTEPEKRDLIRRIATMAVFNTEMQKLCIQRLNIIILGKAFV